MKPETPLPWGFMEDTDYMRDVEFITHACNAHPRLIHAAKSVVEDYDDPKVSVDYAMLKLRELLKELGEL